MFSADADADANAVADREQHMDQQPCQLRGTVPT